MSNDYYNHGTWPATSSSGSSALARTEMDAVTAGFAKLATLTGNANKFTLVNSTSDGQTVSATLSESGGVLTASALTVTGTLTATGGVTGNVTGNVTGAVTGNASTATALQNARTINGVSFNGTANITVADATKLPLAGGALTGPVTMGTSTASLVLTSTTGTNAALYELINTGGTYFFGADNSTGSVFSAGAYGMSLWTSANAAITFANNSLERMRINATGEVGIGRTASVGTTLDVQAATASIRANSSTAGNSVTLSLTNSNGQFNVGRDNSTGSIFGVADANVLYANNNLPMVFFTNTVERLRIGGTGDITGLGVAIVRSKPSLTSRSLTASPADDPDLVVPLSVGKWTIDAMIPLYATSSGAGGEKTQLAFSGTKSNDILYVDGLLGGTTVSFASATLSSSFGIANVATNSISPDLLRITGTITVTVAGNLSVQWSQNTSNANALNFAAGAWIRCVKVA